MTREEIISGLQFTIDMFLFDPNTGEKYTEPRNDMDKTTIDACRGAIELLKQEPNCSEIPTGSEKLSSALEKNSKKLENASPIIDWNNCHTSEQIDSITTTKDDLAVDCISRAEAIKCLECDFNITSKENMKTVVNYINSAHDKIVNLTSVTPQEPRWIPVSERLPEKNMRCLVAVGRFNFTEIATYSDLMGIIDHKIFYQGDVGHDNFKNITQYVKAWMPLLKSYKAESENKG